MTNESILLKKLKRSLPVLNNKLQREIPNLNAGGCGWFAYELAKLLEANGIEYKICILSNSYDLDIEGRQQILNYIKTNGRTKRKSDGMYLSFAHCYIEVDGVKFDGHNNGAALVNLWLRRFELKGYYTLEEMECALEYGEWNKTFDNVKDKAHMEKILKEILN